MGASIGGGGGLMAFLLTLAFALIPFGLIFLLTWIAARRRSALIAALLSLPASILTTISIANSFHDALVKHPDPQSGLIMIFGPLWSLPLAICTWLATAIVLFSANILLQSLRER
jgi:hypothetical protein